MKILKKIGKEGVSPIKFDTDVTISNFDTTFVTKRIFAFKFGGKFVLSMTRTMTKDANIEPLCSRTIENSLPQKKKNGPWLPGIHVDSDCWMSFEEVGECADHHHLLAAAVAPCLAFL